MKIVLLFLLVLSVSHAASANSDAHKQELEHYREIRDKLSPEQREQVGIMLMNVVFCISSWTDFLDKGADMSKLTDDQIEKVAERHARHCHDGHAKKWSAIPIEVKVELWPISLGASREMLEHRRSTAQSMQ